MNIKKNIALGVVMVIIVAALYSVYMNYINSFSSKPSKNHAQQSMDHGNMSGHDMSDMGHGSSGGHSGHDPVSIDDWESIPTVDLNAFIDGMGGINVQIVTENFTWTPENVNTRNVENEGHAHLYLNGEKIARVYNEWHHLDTAKFADGEYILTVTLNGNDHGDYLLGGEKLSDSVFVLLDQEGAPTNEH